MAKAFGMVANEDPRKHMIIKGRRRDTAWFSITDDEWPVLKAGFVIWLDENNFEDNGHQIKTLQQCRMPNGQD